ncbi:hypothetical protein Nstercoris_02059 [Nitrosomonas stercoris]|uniref:DSP-PTPase phosphatase fused to NAD+ Kinase domain-containing protein n=1 Tax=Nitrosomonas stercoris TaxID=1444684 RepID=A0A4Y1YRU5_9PROT|nr:hypothetical protein Nstercoris_02059 [Nitrosomonas stercoris]
MLFVRTIIVLLALLSTNWAIAKDQVPYATQINDLMNYHRTTPTIATSGALSADGVRELVKHGFSTVIDLRTAAEGTDAEKKMVKSAGMTYINIPVANDGVKETQLEAFKQTLEQNSPPFLIHCATGSRAGAMWTAYQLNNGVAPEIALKEGRASGMGSGIEKKVTEYWCAKIEGGC